MDGSMSRLDATPILDYRDLQSTPTNVVLPVLYKRMLRYLSNRTRIRQSEYIREAMRDLLLKYRSDFKGSEFEF